MAENIAKIGFDIIKHNALPENDSVIKKWHKLPITVKTHLSLDEAVAFIYGVVDICFGSDFSYRPENLDPAVRSATVSFYTNIEMPENEYEQYELLYSTDIIQFIYDNIDQGQYDSIIRSINEKVAYNIHVNTYEFKKQVDAFQATVAEMTNQLSEVFGGMSSEEMSSVINAISENGLDEEKLVNAYINSKRD